jgi:hypothetical protein
VVEPDERVSQDRRHPATERTDPWTRRVVPIDDVLVPLVEQLWRHDVRTVGSCEDYNRSGQAWVAFYRPDDAILLAALLSPRLGRPARHDPPAAGVGPVDVRPGASGGGLVLGRARAGRECYA